MGKLNRRNFLKTSAQSAAVIGFSGFVGTDMSQSASDDMQLENDPAEWIRSFVCDYTATSSGNSLRNSVDEKAWDEPLVGFAGGDDPIFQQYKDGLVGPFHWTPLEIFTLAFPDVSIKAEELTVVSWILPHKEEIKADLRKNTKTPSEKWIRARIYGEEFNEELRKHLATSLAESGHPAVAPILSPNFKMDSSGPFGMASTWSERHAAYAAGLGTFGLCDGLITAKGKAIRCGSVVARIRVPATPRPYEDHHAYCLFYAKGICGQCTERCPAGAVTKTGHDKMACMKQCLDTIRYAEKEYGLKGYGCGFCQTGVPCESRIPV